MYVCYSRNLFFLHLCIFDFYFSRGTMNWLNANRLSAKDPLASPSYDLNSRSSVDTKRHHQKNNMQYTTPQKIKSNPSFSLQKINSKTIQSSKQPLSTSAKRKDQFKLPLLRKHSKIQENPQSKNLSLLGKQIFYQSQIYRALKGFQTAYMMSLARQHFSQTIQALRITKNFKLPFPKKEIKLEKKSPYRKTIYLDLDQTLIHTDQRSQSYSVKLSFPIDNGMKIQAGVRIRPYCKQFLEQLSKMAQVIIFTASSASYANVILDHLDPENKYFAHRLYRNHCTLEKGFYVKDLRVVNRNLQDVAIVDNSAFSFLLQPQNGIPILPYYHFAKDRQLQTLLIFLKQLIAEEDCRNLIKKTFFWDAYVKDHQDPKRIFLRRFKKEMEQKN